MKRYKTFFIYPLMDTNRSVHHLHLLHTSVRQMGRLTAKLLVIHTHLLLSYTMRNILRHSSDLVADEVKFFHVNFREFPKENKGQIIYKGLQCKKKTFNTEPLHTRIKRARRHKKTEWNGKINLQSTLENKLNKLKIMGKYNTSSNNNKNGIAKFYRK